MKVDVHVHIFSPEIINNLTYYMEKEPYFRLIYGGLKAKFATAEDVLHNMEKTGVKKSVVFGFPFKDLGVCREINDYIIDVTKKYPEQLTGFAVAPPLDPGFEAEVCRCHEKGLKGVGELVPDAQGFDITNQEQVKKLVCICRERNLPVLIHTSEQVGHSYPGKGRTGPRQAYVFAKYNPEITIVFAHWGGGLFFYELMPELRTELAHVFYDTAASPFLYYPQVYEAARTAGVLPKVMLGSDFPLLSPSRYFKEIARTSLSPVERELVEGKNAARVFF